MSVDADRTQWSLPGPADAPRDPLKAQLEVYNETILLRGFEDDCSWVRTVSANEIARAFTQHLGFSSGLLTASRTGSSEAETRPVLARRCARPRYPPPLLRQDTRASKPFVSPVPRRQSGQRLEASSATRAEPDRAIWRCVDHFCLGALAR